MKQRSILSMLLAGALAVLLFAPGSRAQEFPRTIVEKPVLAPEDHEAIDKWVKERLPGLANDDFQTMKRSRDDLLQPFKYTGISVAFRQSYNDKTVADLRKMAAHQKDLVVVNALRLAGELATSDATAILEEKLNDQRVAVRFAAVNGLERTMAALAARAPAIPNTRVEQLVGKLGAVVEDPKSTPEVVDAGLRALIAAMGTPARSLAFRTLATATGKVAGRFGPIETPPMIQGVLLRAGQATRDALGNVQLELKGESVKDAGALSGHLLSWASCQIKAGQLAAGNKDARVLPTQVVRIAQTSVALACQKAGVARPDEGVNLGGDFEKATPEGDQAFSRNIVKVIQPLVGQGFGFPDGTFLNCKP